MASKNVRKIYSKTSDELVKVDMADRDGQGRVIADTYATKAEAGGGTKKYRHNIFSWWYGGSGAHYVSGYLSFNFINESPLAYGNGGSSAVYNADTFRAFIRDRMGLANGGRVNAVGGYRIGASTLTDSGTIVGLEYDGSSSWYMYVNGQNQYGRYFEETYFTVFPSGSGNCVYVSDKVEAL